MKKVLAVTLLAIIISLCCCGCEESDEARLKKWKKVGEELGNQMEIHYQIHIEF